MLATGKHLLALRCLLAAHAIDPNNPDLHTQIAKFRQSIDNLPEQLAPNVSEIITSEFERVLPKSKNLAEWNDAFLSANSSSPAHVQSALAVRQLLTPQSKVQCEKELTSSLNLDMASVENAMAGLNLLDSWGSDQDAKTVYCDHARKRWKQATVFDVLE